MEGLLGQGARNRTGPEVREEAEAAARWVEAFLGPAYGPFGGAKLVDGPEPQWLESGASALREVPGSHPAIAPYVSLAATVQRHQGDGATGAALLAARLVRHGLEAHADGLPVAAVLQGYRLADRQAAAVLSAAAKSATSEAVLAATAPEGWAASVLAGLPGGGEGGTLDLDAIDVRAEQVSDPRWLPGLVIEPKAAPPAAAAVEGAVLVLTSPWKVGLRTEGASYRLQSAAGLAGAQAAEQAMRDRAVRHLDSLGVRVLLCASSLDEAIRDALASKGVVVVTDAPLSLLRRAEAATGARPVSRLEDATAAEMGRGAARRRRDGDGWLLSGQGPAWTLALPARNAAGKAAARDAGERLLRAAGRVLPDPRAVPGTGRWQRDAAAALRKAADAAPGKAPLAVRAAAKAFDGLADDLVRNAGRDPLAVSVLDGVALDGYVLVRDSVSAAFECATQILRLDGRYDKRPSSTTGLRGTGTPSTLRGMAGDVPPLM